MIDDLSKITGTNAHDTGDPPYIKCYIYYTNIADNRHNHNFWGEQIYHIYQIYIKYPNYLNIADNGHNHNFWGEQVYRTHRNDQSRHSGANI